MRILHICNDYCGSKVHANLYRRLDELGVEQTVYAYYRGGDVRENNVLLRLVEKPVSGKDAMYHESVNGEVPFLTGHHDKGEVAAVGGFSSLEQAANLAVIEFRTRVGEVIGHLNELCDLASVDNSKVNLVVPTILQIVKFLPCLVHASHQFNGYNIFQSPSEVFGLDRVLAFGDKGEVNSIAFASCVSFDALEGKLVDGAEQIGIVEIADVVLDGMNGFHLQVFGDGIIRTLLTEEVKHVIGQLVDGLLVAYLVSLADVLFHNGTKQGLHVGLGIQTPVLHQLREPSAPQILIQRMTTKALCFSGKTLCVNMARSAVFNERERIEVDLVVAPCHVGCEVAAEKIGITASKDQSVMLAKQAIDKERPRLHILYFIEEQMGEGAIYFIQFLKDAVEVGGCNVSKALIIEVDVCESDPAFYQDFLAKRGLAAAAHADDDLCQFAVEVKKPFLPARAEFINIELLKFFFLVVENIRKSIHKCGFGDAKVVKRYGTASKKEHKLHKTASFLLLNCKNRRILRCKLHKTASFRYCKLHKNDKNVQISET